MHGALAGPVALAADLRDDRDAGLEAGQAEGELREDHERHRDDAERAAAALPQLAEVQSPTSPGCAAISTNELTITTRFSDRYTATSTTAMPIASWNPRRNTAPSSTISSR